MPKHTSHPLSQASSQRPSLIRIGPGLIIAFVLALFFGTRWMIQERETRQSTSNGPPIIERPIVSTPEEKLGPIPEVGFLLEHKDTLGLSPAQVSQIDTLQSEWERYSRPKQHQAEVEAQAAQKYLKKTQNNRRTPAAQIEDQAHGIIVLSRELSTARLRFWDRAFRLLTPEQQKLVYQEREAAWASR